MKSLEQLDSWITSKVRNWSGKIAGTPRTAELLEIRRDILNDIRDQIHPKGEGRITFPFNTITIRVAAEEPSQQALFEGALTDGHEWEDAVSSLLREAGCPVPDRLRITVSVAQEPIQPDIDRRFTIDFSNTKASEPPQGPKLPPKAKLTILQGQADSPEYIINSERINLGRLKEVVSDKEGLRRRNHVAFAETETTVSREHAFIRFHHETGQFRLYDALSRRGTHVFRDGRRLEVPKGPTRGFQLRSGDEIHLGDARLAFNTDPN